MEEQINVVSEPTPITQPEKGKKSYIVGLLLFLIICLLGGLTYFILKDRGVDLLSNITGAKDTKETAVDTDTNTKDGTVCPECTTKVVNTGWALYSLPKYGFSVEIPKYILKYNVSINDDAKSNTASVVNTWNASNNLGTTEKDMLGLYPDFLDEIVVNFTHFHILGEKGELCEGLCNGESAVWVYIYKNTGSKDINDVQSVYLTNWNKSLDKEVNNIKGSFTTKWEREVWGYTWAALIEERKGYLVATKDYVYDVQYIFSDTPKASYDIALKVLDSLKFEQ
ncbi:MAG: hypothetical protein UR73_C0004G0003 [candidate division WS6 bacterium GW2011_GWF1_35_23]|uniref:Uncharacterized protein n=1 Tax=candidate division WS6 bacterium GW2011_GWF1_35_23 TaxID=1619097 RepID=A0A0G0FF46_9BACT|nr:MAG: hypothetical protein UR73_C0004G0003 [candidate division WS6 bacterium GW2011_GWF1_35_23]